MDRTDAPISLVARWYMRPGCEAEALAALEGLIKAVEANEPGTLAYRVHTSLGDPSLPSLPPVDASTLLFFETYRSPEAFRAHVEGAVFKDFVAAHGHLFVQADGKPYTSVFFLEPRAGFVRET